jgi:thiamine pyrophosphokinase
MRAIVFANGDRPSAALVAETMRDVGLVVAADGGADHALAHGIVPDAVVGDLDSVSVAAREAIPASRFHHDPDPDATDLDKALRYALDHGATSITILGAGGGRADHALANLSVLPRYRGRANVTIVDDHFEVSVVDGSATIEAPAGTVVSLVAIGTCRGTTTHGLRWDLADFTLEFSPRGVHNEIAHSPATVSVASGDLLLFRGRWVEKHG